MKSKPLNRGVRAQGSALCDRAIVRGILTGSESTLRKFYAQYRPKLSGFVRQRVDNEKDVEEIVHDTLIATIEGLRDFTYRSTLSTYIHSIAKRKVVDYYRRNTLKSTVFSRIPHVEPLISLLTTPEHELDHVFLEEKIQRVQSKLNPHYRMILRLKYVEEYSVKRIARTMNMSFKSAESLLFRARKAFVSAYVNIDTA